MFTNIKLISYFLAPVNYFRMLLHEIFYLAIFFFLLVLINSYLEISTKRVGNQFLL